MSCEVQRRRSRSAWWLRDLSTRPRFPPSEPRVAASSWRLKMVAAAPAITSLIQVKTARGTGRRAPILPLGKISQNSHADVCLPFPGQNLSPQPHLAAGEAGTCTLLTTETVEGSVGAKENVDVCRRRHSRLRLAFSQCVFLGCFDEHLVNAGVTVKYPRHRGQTLSCTQGRQQGRSQGSLCQPAIVNSLDAGL